MCERYILAYDQSFMLKIKFNFFGFKNFGASQSQRGHGSMIYVCMPRWRTTEPACIHDCSSYNGEFTRYTQNLYFSEINTNSKTYIFECNIKRISAFSVTLSERSVTCLGCGHSSIPRVLTSKKIGKICEKTISCKFIYYTVIFLNYQNKLSTYCIKKCSVMLGSFTSEHQICGTANIYRQHKSIAMFGVFKKFNKG